MVGRGSVLCVSRGPPRVLQDRVRVQHGHGRGVGSVPHTHLPGTAGGERGGAGVMAGVSGQFPTLTYPAQLDVRAGIRGQKVCRVGGKGRGWLICVTKLE